MGGALALLAAAWVPPLGLRLALLADKAIVVAPIDGRGLLSDLALAAVVALVAGAAQRLARPLAYAVLLLWLVGNHINFEHVEVLDAVAAPVSARYLLDATFLRGSGLAPTRPLLLAVLAVASFGLAWLACRPRAPRVPLGLLGGLALLSLGASLGWPARDDVLRWRQGNFVPLILADSFVARSAASGAWALPPPDLDGTPIMALGQGRRNVLLVMLEGVSGAYLPSLAKAQGIDYALGMPELDEVLQAGIVYSTFIAQQRQTNRGQYAALCGDYPGLVTGEAEMTRLARQGSLRCLPAVLRDAGYATVYLQAAPPSFMLKDQFMPRIGFGEVLGDRWFRRAYARSQWGVDDRAFFEESLAKIEELRQQGNPWFLTLLTAGTHHPFTVPEEPARGAGGDPHARAIAYLDRAVAAFLRELVRRKVLDETLVLVTSDESAGMERQYDDTTQMLSQSWGLLGVLAPSGQPLRVAEPFAQCDLAISVLDYLGLAAEGADFVGRSVFRRYERSRPLYFGNVNLRTVFALTAPDRLLCCPEDFASCTGYRFEPGRLFGPSRRTTAVADEEVAALTRRGLVEQQRRAADAEGERRYPLAAVREVDLGTDQAPTILFAGQYLRVARGTRVDVDLVVEIAGEGALVELTHDLRSARRAHYRAPRLRLRGGDRAEIRYSLATDEDLAALECRLLGVRLVGRAVRVKFGIAELRLVRPSAPAPSPAGTTVRHFHVERAHDAAPQRYRAGVEANVQLGPCLAPQGDALVGTACQAGSLLWGPYVPAPRGARLRARGRVAAVAGAVTLLGDLVCNQGRELLSQSEPLALAPGEQGSFDLTADLPRSARDVEFRVHLTPAAGTADLRVEEAELTVAWASDGTEAGGRRPPALPPPEEAGNVVVNGHFEDGVHGFESDYRRAAGDLWDEGTYDVVRDAGDGHPDALSYGDQTTGDGLFLMVNGAPAKRPPLPVVWAERVRVAARTEYELELWVSSWTAASPARLSVEVEAEVLGVAVAPAVTGTWERFSARWHSGEEREVTLRIRSAQVAAIGNDFALDDIRLVPAR